MLIVNAALTGWTYYTFRTVYPSDATRLGYKQEVARDLADYNRRLATELDVHDRSAVREALAGFNYDVEMAASSDELTQVILNQGRRVQEIVLREAEAKLQDQVLSAINQDENIQKMEGKLHLSLRISDQFITTVPPDFLQDSTLKRIKELIPEERFDQNYSIELELDNGEARLMVPYNPVEHLQIITEEMDALRLRLHELRVAAGLAEMTGPGITVQLYDELGGTAPGSIIHDTDIRDVVNELFGSGAQGISVGGQRLTATSSIRCSGSLVRVDNKLITVNPVVIEVVGEPDLLISGLDIIRNDLEVKRGLRFEIIPADEIKLPTYTRSTQ